MNKHPNDEIRENASIICGSPSFTYPINNKEYFFNYCDICHVKFRYNGDGMNMPRYCKVCHNKQNEYKKTKYDWD